MSRYSIRVALFLLVAILAVVFSKMPHSYAATSYYVDSNNPSASDAGAGSLAQPWKTLGALNSRTFGAGDTIHFAAGSAYSGTLTINSSGTTGNPIKLKAYNNGAKPTFSNAGGTYLLKLTGNHIIVDGLDFRNTAVIGTWSATTYMESGAVLIQQGADNISVTNSEFSNVGVGVKSYGLNTVITNNSFHDLVIAYSDSDQSYGAIGVSINNSNATIAYNSFVNCRSTNSPYGADGGAIEIEGYMNNKNNISIHHNYSSGSQGFIEVTETQANNVTISQNVSDDYQQFLAFDTTVTPLNFKVEHNTVIRTKTSNVTALFTVLYYREEGAMPSDSWLNIRNNIFYTPAAKVLNGSFTYKAYNFPHSNNVFYDGTSDPVGYPLGSGDMVTDPQFVNFGSRDLRLSASSPAVNAGAMLGYATDFGGLAMPVNGVPDSGAYEYQGTLPLGLQDGGFEHQASTTLVSPWSQEGAGFSGIDLAAGKASTGSNNAWISASTSGEWNALYQTVNVLPNSTYQLSAYVKSSNQIGNQFWLGIRNISNGNKHENQITPSPAGYTKLTATNTYTTGSSETKIVIYMGYISPTGTSWIQFDDVNLKKL
jgi:hypothetical protein